MVLHVKRKCQRKLNELTSNKNGRVVLNELMRMENV